MSIVLDKETFERHFRANHEYLWLLAFQLVQDGEAAEDIVQDFFIDIWRRRDELEIHHNFRTYATAAIRYRCLILLKDIQRRQFHKHRLEILNSLHEESPTTEEWQRIEQSDEKAQQLLTRLPQDRKKIFLDYVSGLSYKQIAAKYHISLNTVKTQMKRTYSLFRKNHH
ncbi:hypothetical protein BWD42_07360 [Sphingobacterium sp. CZ-UAM]|uniref:sigma-70 family RNA polymerase sigma factor n=1 Tax=Sphingobacterium sp. CZ-UAM TaxID=1933868 RepID=UPI00098689EF|nr:sigma-70 family RNA polymerase sigma factor [Sphingobacterium sp. CZ-UAM]OOG19712.1 hypothetical protein BWD42_07360 [Sphingobacterium sp. CZ-UAM]